MPPTDDLKVELLKLQLQYRDRRRAAVDNLLNDLPPKSWAGRASLRLETGHPLIDIDPPTTVVREGVTRYALTAYDHIPECESAWQLAHEVADVMDVQPNTAYRWLCEKNPLYDADSAQREDNRFRQLGLSVVRIVAFQDSPFIRTP